LPEVEKLTQYPADADKKHRCKLQDYSTNTKIFKPMKKLERNEMKKVKGGNITVAFCRTAGQFCNAFKTCCAGLLCDACQQGGINCTCAA
jgi:hypothetical protein